MESVNYPERCGKLIARLGSAETSFEMILDLVKSKKETDESKLTLIKLLSNSTLTKIKETMEEIDD